MKILIDIIMILICFLCLENKSDIIVKIVIIV